MKRVSNHWTYILVDKFKASHITTKESSKSIWMMHPLINTSESNINHANTYGIKQNLLLGAVAFLLQAGELNMQQEKSVIYRVINIQSM